MSIIIVIYTVLSLAACFTLMIAWGPDHRRCMYVYSYMCNLNLYIECGLAPCINCPMHACVCTYMYVHACI